MFTEEEKEAIYKVIYTRRDIRTFLAQPIPIETVMKLLDAAHHAPL
jgi:5,6-dimethylbenzimidazole synthase